jgi:hypothetical protein
VGDGRSRSGHRGSGRVEEEFEGDDAGGFVVAGDTGGYRVDFVIAGEDDFADGDVEVGACPGVQNLGVVGLVDLVGVVPHVLVVGVHRDEIYLGRSNSVR